MEGEIRRVNGVHKSLIHDNESSSDSSRLAKVRNEPGEEIVPQVGRVVMRPFPDARIAMMAVLAAVPAQLRERLVKISSCMRSRRLSRSSDADMGVQ